MAHRLITAPAVEPVTLTEAKAHCIVETSAFDDLITSKLKAARQWVEGYIGRALVAQTWRTTLDRFPCGYGKQRFIYLDRPPLQSVTSITYIDTAGDSQTLATAAYIVDTESEPGRIAEAYGYTWPDTQDRINAVTITSVHGYAGTEESPVDLDNIPEDIKDSIKILTAELYQHRTLTVLGLDKQTLDAVESMLWRHRAVTIAP